MVGVVSRVKVFLYEREDMSRIVIERYCDECCVWIGRFFLEERDQTVGLLFDCAVFWHKADITHVIDTHDRRVFGSAVFGESCQGLAEQVVTGDYRDVIVDATFFDGELQIADSTESFVFIGGTIVEKVDGGAVLIGLSVFCPCIELVEKECVSDDMDLVDPGYAACRVENVIDQELFRGVLDGADREESLGNFEC